MDMNHILEWDQQPRLGDVTQATTGQRAWSATRQGSTGGGERDLDTLFLLLFLYLWVQH